MKWFAAAAALVFVSVTAPGADIFDVIPDDAVVVVVGRSYDESLGAVECYLGAAGVRPAGKQAADARLPLLGDLVALRADFARIAGEPGMNPKAPVALVVSYDRDSGPKRFLYRGVDEETWRAANKDRIVKDPSGAESLKGAPPTWFVFDAGYLVTSASPGASKAYERFAGRPLSTSRRASLQGRVGQHALAVNVSAPTAARIWKDKEAKFCDAVAADFCADYCGYLTGTETVPLPATLVSRMIADFLDYGDEIYLTADASEAALSVSGRVYVKPDGRYAQILAEQVGAAGDAGEIVPKSAVAGLTVGLRGPILWSYLKSLVGPFVAGTGKDASHTAASLAVLTQALEDFQSRVGLERALVCWMPNEGRYPAPVLVAQTKDAAGAVDVVSSSLVKLYSDPTFVNHAADLGFLFTGPPTKELATAGGRTTVTVTQRLQMSARYPVRAARLSVIVGDVFVWRLTALKGADAQFIVAGSFPTDKDLSSFLAGLEAGTPAAGAADVKSTAGANPVTIGAFIDLPAFAARRLMAAAKGDGRSTSSIPAPQAAHTAALAASAEPDGLRFDALVPADQVKALYNLVAGASGGVAEKPAKPAPGVVKKQPGAEKGGAEPETKPRKKSGWGRD